VNSSQWCVYDEDIRASESELWNAGRHANTEGLEEGLVGLAYEQLSGNLKQYGLGYVEDAA
jgi:hypothetical protein